MTHTYQGYTYQGYRNYPPKELQSEIKALFLRVGIAPTRTIMNRVKALNEEGAIRARDILLRVASAAERARRHHPEGKRATPRQLSDWDRWMSSTGTEVTPEALAHFLNLDTTTANREIMNLRFIVWGEQDAKGKTTPMRAGRGLVTNNYVPQKQSPSKGDAPVTVDRPRKLTFEEL